MLHKKTLDKTMKYIIGILSVLLLLFFAFKKTKAQDTVNIMPVMINQSNANFFSGMNSDSPDSLLQAIYSDCKLSSLLRASGSCSVRDYGSGGLASSSLRGTSSNHLQVNWNGIPINSLTAGTMDFSLLNGFLFDNISVNTSPAGSLRGSGAVGGSINLNSEPKFDKGTGFSAETKFGSFSLFKQSLNFRHSAKRFYYRLRGIRRQAKNNFPYTDYYKTGHPKVYQTNNAFRNNSLMQDFSLKFKNNLLVKSSYWYSEKDAEIPEAAGNYGEGFKHQKDSCHRLYIALEKLTTAGKWSVSSALFSSYIHYTDKLSKEGNFTVNSKILNLQNINTIDYRRSFPKGTVIGAGAFLHSAEARGENYTGNPQEHRYRFYAAALKKTQNYKFKLSAGVENKYSGGIIPTVSALAFYKSKNERIKLQLSAANKYRRPNFNELYWNTGNSSDDLKAEYGYDIQIKSDYLLWSNNKIHSLTFEHKLYYLHMKALIQWIPKSGIWIPVNYKELNSSGADISLKHRFKKSETEIQNSLKWFYNYAQITTGENATYRPPYAPKNKFLLTNSFLHSDFSATLNTIITGKRYTVPENNLQTQLPAYLIADFFASYRFCSEKKFNFKFSIEIKNILDRQYESVRSYYMPGRNIAFAAEIIFNSR